MLFLAMIIDALLGEPRWLWSRVPHPVVLMGASIDFADRRFNTGDFRRARGIVTILVLCALWGGGAWVLTLAPHGWVLEVLGAAILIAHRSLAGHVMDVARALDVSLEAGRAAVSRIVGRDPNQLDAPGVARAAIESAAENFSDGVVAPVFWFLLFGLPGIVVYKLVNTADSMVGYRIIRYREFGWASARLDDFLNFAPARISAYLLCFVGAGLRAMRQVRHEAPHHRSPNAGWPESAMAIGLDVSLAGPRRYHGEWTDDHFIHPSGGVPDTEDVRHAVSMLWRAWAVMVFLSVFTGALWAMTEFDGSNATGGPEGPPVILSDPASDPAPEVGQAQPATETPKAGTPRFVTRSATGQPGQ